MSEILTGFSTVTVRDLKDLVGLPTTYVDERWGWTELDGAEISQVRTGYLLFLPPANALGTGDENFIVPAIQFKNEKQFNNLFRWYDTPEDRDAHYQEHYASNNSVVRVDLHIRVETLKED